MTVDKTVATAEGGGDMTRDQMIAHIRAANEVARNAALHGHHPFGAVLVGPDDRILMRQSNINTVRHAETELARRAAEAYPPEFLWTCTLVSTGEPCAMCTGTHTRWQLVSNDGTGAPTLTDMGAGFGIATGGVLTLFIAPHRTAVPSGCGWSTRSLARCSSRDHSRHVSQYAVMSPRLFME